MLIETLSCFASQLDIITLHSFNFNTTYGQCPNAHQITVYSVP